MPNNELLKQTLKTVEWAADQGRWLQDRWGVDLDDLDVSEEPLRTYHGLAECGTAYCFAGWLGQNEGVEPHRFFDGTKSFSSLDRSQFTDEELEAICENWSNWTLSADRLYATGGVPISQWAAWKLGLTANQACHLFAGDNSLRRLQSLVDEYTKEAN